jgi:hypothetical protein
LTNAARPLLLHVPASDSIVSVGNDRGGEEIFGGGARRVRPLEKLRAVMQSVKETCATLGKGTSRCDQALRQYLSSD